MARCTRKNYRGVRARRRSRSARVSDAQFGTAARRWLNSAERAPLPPSSPAAFRGAAAPFSAFAARTLPIAPTVCKPLPSTLLAAFRARCATSDRSRVCFTHIRGSSAFLIELGTHEMSSSRGISGSGSGGRGISSRGSGSTTRAVLTHRACACPPRRATTRLPTRAVRCCARRRVHSTLLRGRRSRGTFLAPWSVVSE